MRTNFKKWFIIIGITIAVIAGIVGIMYNNAQKPYEKAKMTAVQEAKERTALTEVEEVYLYNGTTAYYTVTGKDKSGQNVAVWIAEDGKSEPVLKPLAQGVTEKEARALFREESGKAEILTLTLGMEKETPVWLFTFKNDKGKLNYYYLSFEDGKWWRKVENI
ncbi:cell wall elongation regulator TseB-like domain-containing protein [Domibacillus epiphyticus]|uniref:Cell wall elongation regulator TseB-like domain-containing protein n=1 Tax=Domibacillus epiphyticus TaxID=1714355 RepID=A0A1V2A4A8_9BACI|nr:DUF5590 domain-containing protein [Domibacillus epiphyticus]OMP65838.1 hypothetical protein BTO28_14865 [Domibacillus epiphyticus]